MYLILCIEVAIVDVVIGVNYVYIFVDPYRTTNGSILISSIRKALPVSSGGSLSYLLYMISTTSSFLTLPLGTPF